MDEQPDHIPRLNSVWLIETESLNFSPGLSHNRIITSVIGGAVCVREDGLLATAAHNIPEANERNCTARLATDNHMRMAKFERKWDHLDLALLWVEKLNENEVFPCIAPSIDAHFGPLYGGEPVFAYIHQQRLMFSRVSATVAYPFPVLPGGAIPVNDRRTIQDMLQQKVKFENAGDAFSETFPYRKAGHVYVHPDQITHLNPALPVIQLHGFHVLRGASGSPVFKYGDNSCIGLIIFDKGGYDFLVPSVAIVAVLALRIYERPDAGEFKNINMEEFKDINPGTVGKKRQRGTKGDRNPRRGKRGKGNQGPSIGKNKATNFTNNKPSESVAVYSEEGSNSPFDFAVGFPVIELKDAESDSDEFPEVSSAFKDVTSSELLRAMTTTVENSSENRPEHVDKILRKSSVEQMTINNVVSSSEVKPEEYEIRMMFKYRESLWHAAHLADKCTEYLVSDPYHAMVQQFDLEELGDMVFLSEGRVIPVPELPTIGCLPSLN